MAEYAITGDVATLLGGDHNTGDPAALWVEASQPILIVDSEGRTGGRIRVPLADNGTFTASGLPETVSGAAPLYRLHVDSLSLRLAGKRKGMTTGWFPLTANRDLAWVVTNYVETTLVTAEVAANVAAAAALGATNDTVTASFVRDVDSETSRALTERRPAPIDYLHARLAQTARGPVRAVMLGSSTALGTGASHLSRSFAELLTARIQRAYPSGVAGWEPTPVRSDTVAATPNLPGFHMANAAFGGTTSADYVVAGTLLHANTIQPHVFFHAVGQNDYRNDIPPATTIANLTDALADLDGSTSQSAIHVLIASYAMPVETAPAYPWSDYVDALRTVAEAHPRGVFVDASTAFVQAGSSGPSASDPLDLIGTDAIHATDAGHALLASETANQLGIAVDVPRAAPTVVDRFARKTLGAAETGQTWTQQATSVHVPNGTYLTCTTSGNVVVDPGFSDAEVSAIVTYSAGALTGILAKSNGDTTRLFWGIHPTLGAGSTPILVFYMGATLLASTSITSLSPTAGREYHLRLIAKGDRLVGYLDGREWLAHTLGSTDATTYSAYTQHGVRCNSTSGSPKWRNFSVRAL